MNERGFVGGFEVLPFGLLVFVAGSLLFTNAWAVMDGKLAASAAAREAARVFVESTSLEAGRTAAVDTALETIDGHGRDPARAEVVWEAGPDLSRCALALAWDYRDTDAVAGADVVALTVTADHPTRLLRLLPLPFQTIERTVTVRIEGVR